MLAASLPHPVIDSVTNSEAQAQTVIQAARGFYLRLHQAFGAAVDE
eukprot:CAMPEP_0206058258 /NCGR_PEP_ID=MMETSP1466-20131121/46253_1 /ASSEMBLY_ACC=CAM_ASM_001126 /TAXON_ID=44452 /ORGANISM="Pavlova gyrans, Strain CCMP608" /LENGTH=45 /DNA_ID= /DNA_START= /DNA_END= /DNA_ORIENTATION=